MTSPDTPTRPLSPILGVILVLALVLLVVAFAAPWVGTSTKATATANPTVSWYAKGDLTTRAVTDGVVANAAAGAFLRDGANLAMVGLAFTAVVSLVWVWLRLSPLTRTRPGAWLNAAMAAILVIPAALTVAGASRFVAAMAAGYADRATAATLQAGGLVWLLSVPAIVILLFGIATLLLAVRAWERETRRAVGGAALEARFLPTGLLPWAALACTVAAATVHVLPWLSLTFNAADASGNAQEVSFLYDRGRLEALALLPTAAGAVALPASQGAIAFTNAMQQEVTALVANLDLAAKALAWAAVAFAVAHVGATLAEGRRGPVASRLVVLGGGIAAVLLSLVGAASLVAAALHTGALNAALTAGGAPATTTFGLPWNLVPYLAALAAVALAGAAFAIMAPATLRYVTEAAAAAENGGTTPALPSGDPWGREPTAASGGSTDPAAGD